MDAGVTTVSMTNRTGAVRWMAPEVLDNGQGSYASDTYSFGCTCLEVRVAISHFPKLLIIIYRKKIITQTHPFPELPDHGVKEAIVGGNNPQWPDRLTEVTAIDRIGRTIGPCFAREPESRPSMEELASRLTAVVMPENDANESDHIDIVDQAPWKDIPLENSNVIHSDVSLGMLPGSRIIVPYSFYSVHFAETQEQALKSSLNGLHRALEMFGCFHPPGSTSKELELKEVSPRYHVTNSSASSQRKAASHLFRSARAIRRHLPHILPWSYHFCI